MPISTEERASAKKAYDEMTCRDSSRAFLIMFGGLLVIPTTLPFAQSILDHEEPLQVWNKMVSGFRFGGILWIYLLIQLMNYRRYQARYADNLKVVSELEQRYALELPYGLEQEIQSAPNKKPLLWRVDALLSRKKVFP